MPSAAAASRKPARWAAYGTNSASQPTTRPPGTQRLSRSDRRPGSAQSVRLTRSVRATVTRSAARAGWSASPNHPTAADTARRASASRKTWYGLSHTSRMPASPNPAICMTPTLVFMVARASTKAFTGTMSVSSAHLAPAATDPTYAVTKMIAKRAQSGSPGTAWSAAPAAANRAASVIARRGGTLSAADSSVRLPRTPASGAPNMLSAVSRAEPVDA